MLVLSFLKKIIWETKKWPFYAFLQFKRQFHWSSEVKPHLFQKGLHLKQNWPFQKKKLLLFQHLTNLCYSHCHLLYDWRRLHWHILHTVFDVSMAKLGRNWCKISKVKLSKCWKSLRSKTKYRSIQFSSLPD